MSWPGGIRGTCLHKSASLTSGASQGRARTAWMPQAHAMLTRLCLGCTLQVARCPNARPHDWTECPYAHVGEKARRRDPRCFTYAGVACPDFRKGSCKRGDACPYAHGVFECWLHPSRCAAVLCMRASLLPPLLPAHMHLDSWLATRPALILFLHTACDPTSGLCPPTRCNTPSPLPPSSPLVCCRYKTEICRVSEPAVATACGDTLCACIR